MVTEKLTKSNIRKRFSLLEDGAIRSKNWEDGWKKFDDKLSININEFVTLKGELDDIFELVKKSASENEINLAVKEPKHFKIKLEQAEDRGVKVDLSEISYNGEEYYRLSFHRSEGVVIEDEGEQELEEVKAEEKAR